MVAELTKEGVLSYVHRRGEVHLDRCGYFGHEEYVTDVGSRTMPYGVAKR